MVRMSVVQETKLKTCKNFYHRVLEGRYLLALLYPAQVLSSNLATDSFITAFVVKRILQNQFYGLLVLAFSFHELSVVLLEWQLGV